jgi:hypothetical protein
LDKAVGRMKMTTHFKLVLSLRMHRALFSFRLYAFIAWYLGTKKELYLMYGYRCPERIFVTLLIGF